MKKLIFCLLLGTQSLLAGAQCTSLSGTYEFKGFDGHDCSLNNQTRRLDPLPLGDIIQANALITVKQTGCHSLELIYSDDRFENTKGQRKAHELNDESITSSKGMLKFEDSGKNSYCGMGGCLSDIYSKSWSLGLDQDRNLRLSYRYKSVGLLNYIVPIVNIVKADCTLQRVP